MVNATLFYILVVVLVVLMKTNASPVNLTRVYSAVAKGAVCLDGSPPAYHFDKGVGEGINNWLVHLEGGAWCHTLGKCSNRSKSLLGSSYQMQRRSFYGILSNTEKDNPNFYNWNRVMVRYCDGSSFTGDVEKVDYPKFKVYMRGARVFDAVMEDLLERGMKNASNALLSGNSAGGLASILHCDKFRTLLASKARVKCLSDGGYFLHAKDFYGGYHFEYEKFDKIVSVHGSAKNLPHSCTSKIKPSLCFYPQNVVQHIQTPLFILNSVFDTYQLENIFSLSYIPVDRSWKKCQYNTTYCSSRQIKKLEGLQSEFVHTILATLGNPSSRSLFIHSCHSHCQSLYGPKWFGPKLKLNDKTVSEAVGDWFYERRVVQLVDRKHNLPRWCLYDNSERSPNNNFTWPNN